MADDQSPPDGEDQDREDRQDRAAILARRNVFIAAALSGLGALSGCSSSHGPGGADTGPAACLSIALDATVDTSPMPCLSDTGAPMPCLGAPLDTGVDAPPMPCLDVVVDSGSADAGPAVCLSMALPDAGTDDAGADDAGDAAPDAPPMPCLTPPP